MGLFDHRGKMGGILKIFREINLLLWDDLKD
jgi:hypothetical protein